MEKGKECEFNNIREKLEIIGENIQSRYKVQNVTIKRYINLEICYIIIKFKIFNIGLTIDLKSDINFIIADIERMIENEIILKFRK